MKKSLFLLLSVLLAVTCGRNASIVRETIEADGVEQTYVEEVGSMNMMFAYGTKIVTPKLNGREERKADGSLRHRHRRGYQPGGRAGHEG